MGLKSPEQGRQEAGMPIEALRKSALLKFDGITMEVLAKQGLESKG